MSAHASQANAWDEGVHPCLVIRYSGNTENKRQHLKVSRRAEEPYYAPSARYYITIKGKSQAPELKAVVHQDESHCDQSPLRVLHIFRAFKNFLGQSPPQYLQSVSRFHRVRAPQTQGRPLFQSSTPSSLPSCLHLRNHLTRPPPLRPASRVFEHDSLCRTATSPHNCQTSSTAVEAPRTAESPCLCEPPLPPLSGLLCPR